MSKVRENKNIDIYKLAERLLNEIKPQVKKVEIAGSVRRNDPGANDIDFVIIPKKDTIIKLKDSMGTNWTGDKKTQHVLKNKVTVDLLFTTPDSWGAALLHLTGPKGYEIGLRLRAKKQGWKLNEYGLFNENGKRLAGKKEIDILKAFGKTYKKPEDR